MRADRVVDCLATQAKPGVNDASAERPCRARNFYFARGRQTGRNCCYGYRPISARKWNGCFRADRGPSRAVASGSWRRQGFRVRATRAAGDLERPDVMCGREGELETRTMGRLGHQRGAGGRLNAQDQESDPPRQGRHARNYSSIARRPGRFCEKR
jgi:hypothetical protein